MKVRVATGAMLTTETELQRRQRANGRDTYAALLDAALAIWSEEGINRVTMQAVAERAGRTRGIMYHHFRDRDDLIAAVQIHLRDRLAHVFDFAKTPSRNDYLMVAGLMVDSPELVRSFLSRLLAGDAREDSLLAIARSHYREVKARNWLRPDIDADHAAVISLSMWLASMMAVDLKQNLSDRRAEASRFAETFQRVMESSIIYPEIERPTAGESASLSRSKNR
jgi:AcrR family transcriptional regulator